MTDRAVNTVVDVALAILFVAVATSLLTTLPADGGDDHDHVDADRTAAVVGSATLDVTYSTDNVLETAVSDGDAATPETDGNEVRVSHGSIASQIGDVALANVTREDATPPTQTGQVYERALDERLQSRLVGSQFETRVTAIWEPYDGAPIRGRAAAGRDPPDAEATSTATLSIPSGIGPVRDEAVAVAGDGGSYEDVARVVAATLVEAYLPVRKSKHALEDGGVARVRTRYRYERMATLVDGASPDDPVMQDALEREYADPAAANEYLTSRLAAQLATDMATSFDSPERAARALSVGEVLVTIRTWEP